MLYLLIFLTITALTTENVVRALKGVYWHTVCHDVLDMLYSQQRKIEREFSNDDQCRTAAVDLYLYNNPYASWRRIIRVLDWRGEHHEMQRYAEKLTGMFSNFIYCISTRCHYSEIYFKALFNAATNLG